MANNTVVTETPEEKDKKILPQEKPIGQEVREKSFGQLLKEDSEQKHSGLVAKDDKLAEEKDENKQKEEQEALEAKQKIEAEEVERKRLDEAVKKAAEEVLAKQKQEEQAKLDKIQEEENKKKRLEDLKPKFTGRDEKGNIVPKSYEELHEEDVRVAKELVKEEVLAELETREKQKIEEQEKQKQQQELNEKQKKDTQKTFEEQLQKELDADLKDLYEKNKLPKVTDPTNPNDVGNREFKNLFDTAQQVNAERMAKGEAPIRSIKLIYYEYYKPLGKLPGHNAPVLGNESPLSNELPEDKYIISRDRNKSVPQLLKEEKDRLTRRLNIRGN